MTVSATAATQTGKPTWENVATDPAYLNGELIIGRDNENHQYGGPIKSITIEDNQVVIKLMRLAHHRKPDLPWAWAPDLDATYYGSAQWSILGMDSNGTINCTIASEHGVPRHSRLRPNSLQPMDPRRILNEYHYRVLTPGPLYPPSPLEDLNWVGLVSAHEPKRYNSNDEVRVWAIYFVVYAQTEEAGANWCRAECGRVQLPVKEITTTRLKPGY